MSDVWRVITDSKWHPHPEGVTKQEMMDKAGYEEVFMMGKWCVVKAGDAVSPWIMHYCYAQLHSENTWNYVLSSLASLQSKDKACHYDCTECLEKAPDVELICITSTGISAAWRATGRPLIQ